MKSFIIPFVLLLFISCENNKQESNITNNIAKVETPKAIIPTITKNVITINDELYTLQFKIEKTKNNTHNLVIDMKLHKGSSFISPFEEKEFSGKFYMDLGSYKNLSFNGNVIETPKAIARYDAFGNNLVIWVDKNTTYKQPLNIKLEEDFEVFGRVRFTIEPRCSLEEISFGISYKDGVMTLFEPKC